MNSPSKPSYKFDIAVTIRADDPIKARKIITRKIHAHWSDMGAEDPIENYSIGGSSIGESMWKSLNVHPAPKNEAPFFAIDSGNSSAEEFSRAIRWDKKRSAFIDTNLDVFPFTHWMAIPKV